MTLDPAAKAGFSLLSLALSVLAISGCAHRETTVTTYTLPHQATRSWVGVRVEDVLRLWGQPAEKSSDGEGGTVLTYRTKSKMQVSTTVDEHGKPTDWGTPNSRYPDQPGQRANVEIPGDPSAVFYISPKGLVYRYTISSELLGSGKAPDAPLPDAPARPPD